MIEVKIEEPETPNQEASETKMDEDTTVNAAAPEPPPPPSPTETQPLQPPQPQPQPQPLSSQYDQNNSSEVTTLNPLNEPESNNDAEAKQKHRRYWTPKEEEKFFEIWGRENWRLTKHGKNTIFFAKWSEEMKERFNIDVKLEEVQCKVNQTRAKFRQVKKMLETNKNAVITWKKYDLVEKILKNKYRSKDDEPVPPEAIENNRDYSPTELLNCTTQPCSPNSMSNMSNIPEHNINLSQSLNVDHQLTDEVNMSATSLSDHNLFSNNSQSGTSFSTELFGSDQLEIKEEIENDIKCEGFTELLTADGASTADATVNNTNKTAEQQPTEDNQHTLQQQQPSSLPQQVPLTENNTNMEHVQQINSSHSNSLLIQNRLNTNHNSNNTAAAAAADGIVNFVNHVTNNSMQPPKTMIITPSPRKRNRANSISTTTTPLSSETLETLYLEEVRKKNVLLVEQGEINRKRLRLEERKVKLMEEFFPKFMNLQQDILKKLETVSTETPTSIKIKLEE